MSAVKYKKDEVVWAKIRGFPWWPAVVAAAEDEEDEDNSQVLINFIGENSHANLPLDKVAKYKEMYEEYSKNKKHGLKEAVEVANKILNKETTYESTD